MEYLHNACAWYLWQLLSGANKIEPDVASEHLLLIATSPKLPGYQRLHVAHAYWPWKSLKYDCTRGQILDVALYQENNIVVSTCPNRVFPMTARQCQQGLWSQQRSEGMHQGGEGGGLRCTNLLQGFFWPRIWNYPHMMLEWASLSWILNQSFSTTFR